MKGAQGALTLGHAIMLVFLAAVALVSFALIVYAIPYSGHEQLIESALTTAGVVIFGGAGLYAISSASPRLIQPAAKDRRIQTNTKQATLLSAPVSIQVSSTEELRKLAGLLGEPLLKPSDEEARESENFDVVIHDQLRYYFEKTEATKAITREIHDALQKGAESKPGSPTGKG